MNRYAYSTLYSSKNSIDIQRFSWRAIAFSCATLLLTFWSGALFSRTRQGSLNFDARIEKDGKEKVERDPFLVVVAPAGTFNGSYDYSGLIKGTRVWKGIRFGKNPVRFASPELADPLPPGQIYQNYDSPGCQQGNSGTYFQYNPGNWISEDCLFLSVRAPPLPPAEGSGYPVLVWFHPGGFGEGLGANYPRSDTSAFVMNGIIGVTGNFRLNIFGALTTSTTIGNFGLEDQRLLLQWIQINIASFGGDPSKVTLYGESSGGQSVACHIASPASAGLFSGGIMESYAAGYPFPSRAQALNVSSLLFKGAGCAMDDLVCMRSKTVDQLFQACDYLSLVAPDIYTTWYPVVDAHSDLPIQPYTAIKTGQYADVSILLGFDRDEADYFVYLKDTTAIPPEEYPGAISYFVERFMSTVPNQDEVESKLLSYYPLAVDAKDGRAPLGDLVTDAFFACPSLEMLESAAELGSKPAIFAYMYDYIDRYDRLRNITQIIHGYELQCAFDTGNWPGPGDYATDPEEQLFCHNLNVEFSNFIKSGDPRVGKHVTPFIPWAPMDSTGNITMMSPKSTLGQYSRTSICTDFWNKIVGETDGAIL